MTNQRICDYCKKVIDLGLDYYKLQRITHEGKRQLYTSGGHLCIECYSKITGKE